MIRPLLISFTALSFCSLANAAPAVHQIDVAYDIANPLRPGAKAPYCDAQLETVDGCTFHSVAGDTYDAHLSRKPGETWIASPSDAATIKIQNIPEQDVADGTQYQLIKIAPSPKKNADATVTFDRLSGEPGSLKVIERRRITVMVHPG